MWGSAVGSLLLLEWIMRRSEIKDGVTFSRENIRFRKCVMITIGTAAFIGIWLYLVLSHNDPLRYLIL